jgi:hypothetical protein
MRRAIELEVQYEGYFHPKSELEAEFVDIDGFVRIPVEGLTETVHFYIMRAEDDDSPPSSELAVAPIQSVDMQERIRAAVEQRFSVDSCTFLIDDSGDEAAVSQRSGQLSQRAAAAIAVMTCSPSLDESMFIRVGDALKRYAFKVEYGSDRYFALPNAEE